MIVNDNQLLDFEKKLLRGSVDNFVWVQDDVTLSWEMAKVTAVISQRKECVLERKNGSTSTVC